ncbi:hypothetical protein MTR_7g056360 [Medicago truncatula]|uniref:Uncharacterized protein n=1 Tax=Medicago truncatula TaxID=3880 RepID=A0A072TYZ3_MEDTR|nr:hypothetical protein MTR_7g056360 [Medicago truncatula]
MAYVLYVDFWPSSIYNTDLSYCLHRIVVFVPVELLEDAKTSAKAALEEMDAD